MQAHQMRQVLQIYLSTVLCFANIGRNLGSEMVHSSNTRDPVALHAGDINPPTSSGCHDVTISAIK